MRLIADESVVPAIRALSGAIAVDEGSTDEQWALLHAVVEHLSVHVESVLLELTPLGPGSGSESVSSEADRRRVEEDDEVTLELCRHPESIAQVRTRGGLRARALGDARTRDWRSSAVGFRTVRDRATEDFDRFYGAKLERSRSRSYGTTTSQIDMPDLSGGGVSPHCTISPSGTLGHA